VALDAAHLRAGAFTYARQGDRVDISLILREPNGGVVREATAFAGSPAPSSPEPKADADTGKQRDGLARENARLKADLATQVERNKLLEKALEELRKVVTREEQRKRLEHQAPDVAK
jgi:hypothetical protein